MTARLKGVLRLSTLDLWRSRRAVLLTLISLTVGFGALFISLGLRDSQRLLVRNKAREILTGDVQLSATRPFEDAELNEFRRVFQPIKESPEVDLFANLRAAERAILVELKAVAETFPLVGQVHLSTGTANFANLRQGEIWLADELRRDLNLRLGQSIKLGEAELLITGFIVADIGVKRGATGFAPRAYIHRSNLAATQLIQTGSQVQYRLTATLPSIVPIPELSSRLENWREDVIVRGPEDAVNGIKRGLSAVEKFLSLVNLLLMVLGFVSGFYLLQIHLRSRAASLALQLLFGASARTLEIAITGQIALLLGVASATAAVVVVALFAALNPLIRELLPAGIELVLGGQSWLMGAAVWLLNSLVFSLPFASRIRNLEPDILLNQTAPTLPMLSLRRDFTPYLLAMVAYASLTAWLLDSWQMMVAINGLLAALAFLAARALPSISARFGRQTQSRGLSRLAWLGLARPRLVTTLIWLSLAWSACLTAAIPNLLAAAREELRPPATSELPQLFAINVQKDDIEPLGKMVADLGGELRHVSPLILGRLLKVNGQPPQDSRLARFPVRLTYRAELSNSERLVAGSALPPRHSGSANQIGISVERDFAKRNRLNLGDQLEFEIAGLPLNARIQNFREVRWSTFQPNFFLQFPTGVLEDYPQSYLGVIYGLNQDELFRSQSQLATRFPTLSLLNLAATIDRLAELAKKLVLPITAVSGAGLVIVLMLITLLTFHLWQEREEERQLLHGLGATANQIRSILSRESLFLGASALVVGNLLGMGLAVISGKRLFERWIWPAEVLPVALLTILSLILCLLPARWSRPPGSS